MDNIQASLSPIHRTLYRVIYADTDSMGVVYHANYFKWFEIGRAELFRSLNMPYKSIEEQGFMLPITEAACKYAVPARYDDLLIIETTIDTSFRAGIKFLYRIFTEANEIRLAEGYTRHAFVDAKGRVVRPPAFITSLIKQYCSGITSA